MFDGGAVAFLFVLKRIAVSLFTLAKEWRLLYNLPFVFKKKTNKQKKKNNQKEHSRNLNKGDPSVLCFRLIFMAREKGNQRWHPFFFMVLREWVGIPMFHFRME